MEASEDPDERQVVCSACLQVVAEPLIHVIPAYNADLSRFVTTYRCETCWLPSLEETRTRLAGTEDWAEMLSLIDCLERHGVFLFEYRRGDPMPAVRALLEPAIDLLARGTIKLAAGPLQ